MATINLYNDLWQKADAKAKDRKTVFESPRAITTDPRTGKDKPLFRKVTLAGQPEVFTDGTDMLREVANVARSAENRDGVKVADPRVSLPGGNRVKVSNTNKGEILAETIDAIAEREETAENATRGQTAEERGANIPAGSANTGAMVK